MQSNHGNVGEVIYMKMTPEKFKTMTSFEYQHGTVLNTKEMNDLKGCCYASVPVVIDNNTQGEYEAVCFYGTEIH